MKKNPYILFLLMISLNFSCNKEETADMGDFKTKALAIAEAKTDKTMYRSGESVSFSFVIENPTGSALLEISKVRLVVKNLTDKENPLHTIGESAMVGENVTIEAGNALTIDANS
ncbi:MAG: hypothetical protein PHS71_04525, partial [Proteiniphilum sp.]|nr:hypothetical protein [Proteiniphilum sp.]